MGAMKKMNRLNSIVFSSMLLFHLGCKPKEASLQDSNTSAVPQKKYEWCRPSSQALSSILESVREFERSGRDSITNSSDGKRINPSAVSQNALAMLDKPPTDEVPSCGSNLDNALTSTGQQIAGILAGKTPPIALNATGGSCEYVSRSGDIFTATKLPGGKYRIQMSNCEGRIITEMLVPGHVLKGLILKGV